MPAQIRLLGMRLAFAAAALVAHIPAIAGEAGQSGDSRWAVSAGLGNLGVQGQLSYQLNDRWALSAIANGIDRGIDIDGEEVDYDSDVDINVWGLQFDWRPWQDYLRLSAGIFSNDSRIKAIATTPGNSITLSGVSIPIDDGEAVNAAVKWRGVAPYLGLGFGNIFGRERQWALLVDFGLLYVGEPDVKVSATSGSALNEVVFRSQVEDEERRIRDDLKDLRVLPVGTLRIAFRF